MSQNALYSACGMPAMAWHWAILPGATVIAGALVGFEFGKFSSGQPSIGEYFFVLTSFCTGNAH